MFNIVKSNRMETLMAAMASSLREVPDNPMSPEWIGIQSRGMKQWICLKMARDLGVCANIRFLFPRQMVDHILTCFSPLEDPREPVADLTEEQLFWSVMKQIYENRSRKELSPIEDYIRADETGKKLYQLSLKIAKGFDDYQVYRPEMLCTWQAKKGHATLKDPAALWQAWLWQQVASKQGRPHLANRIQDFLERGTETEIRPDLLPPRMSFFGISALPPVFLQVFEKTADIMDINLFLLSPSNQFFFDIKSQRQLERLTLAEALKAESSGPDPEHLYYEMTNPLLSSLGASGKSFHAGLETFNYHEPFEDLYQDPLDESRTMLAWLQSDILNLVHRKQGQADGPVFIEPSDTSVTIHACHSPMREAQVLKDLLLKAFQQDPDLAPHDIIVMMPDIETYAPFIDAVFSLETHLPFSISDRRKRSESEPVEAFLKILALRNTRLEQSCVLDLLLSDSIARKFDITFDEIGMIEKMAKDAGILWGRDADHRQTLGLTAFEENTWQFGFERLFMGMAMPEHHEDLVQGILPCQPFEGLDLEVLGKFAAFCQTLFEHLAALRGQNTMDAWCSVLNKVIASLMDRNYTNGKDVIFLAQTLDEIREDAHKAGFCHAVPFDLLASVLEQKLDQTISQGNFLSGAITFCNIMPMRSIPFKIVVFMGMDEKSFPRQAFSPGFDLIKKYPKPGDKNARDEDRYLFLETLLSARSKLIFTYTGMSIQDNSKIPCAGVLSELSDTMDHSFIFPDTYACHFFHPLHPFDEGYFNQTGPLFSFSQDNCVIAKALSQNRSEKPGFAAIPSGVKSKAAASRISLDEIIRFFRNPVEGYMKQGLNIQIREIEEQTLDRESFTLSGLDQYALGSFLVEKKSGPASTRDYYPFFKAAGCLPFGEKGRLEYERIMATAGPVIEKAVAVASKTPLPGIAVEAEINGVTISAGFPDIREDGVYYLSYGKLNSARVLSGWIRHLFFNISAPKDYPCQTLLMGRDPAGKKEVQTCVFPALKTDARPYLETLVKIYDAGLIQPFYFFCETAWQFAQALSKEGFELTRETISQAMNLPKIRAGWYGNAFQTGEKDNRYVSLCVDKKDPFQSVDALMSSGFARNAVTVYKPLMENLKRLP